MEQQFPYDVTDELGEVQFQEKLCPGVYFISCIPKEGAGLCSEFYIVEDEASAIPRTIKKLGRKLEDNTTLLAYALEDVSGGKKIIEYESSKYQVMHGADLPEGVTLRSLAIDGMETNPEYFGTYPVPSNTSLGYTLRHKSIDNGVYWIETDQCCRVLAVCSVLCEELSDTAEKLAFGKSSPELNYLFFTKEASCIPIFELMQARPQWWTSGTINKEALENAIWRYYPEYAANYNLQEAAGQHDIVGSLLNDLNIPAELSHSDKRMIVLSPEAGTEFFALME